MKLTYDPRANVAYLRLREQRDEVETLSVAEDLRVDFALDGSVYGIEFLNAGAQLRGADGGALVIVNQATGDRQVVPLAP